MALTLDQLVLTIAKRFGHAQDGIATSGSSTTLVDTPRLYQANEYWNDATIYFLAGGNPGVSRIISSYSAVTLSWASALSVAVINGDTYQVLPRGRQDFVDAIQEAIRKAGESWMVMKDDTTSLDFSTAQEYTLPADLVTLNAVYAGDGTYWAPVLAWEVLPNSAEAYKLMIRQWPKWPYLQDAGQVALSDMRLEYLALPTSLTAGADVLGMATNVERECVSFIVEYALHLLHQNELAHNVTGLAARTHVTLAEKHYNEAMRVMAMRKVNTQPKRIRTRAYPTQIQ